MPFRHTAIAGLGALSIAAFLGTAAQAQSSYQTAPGATAGTSVTGNVTNTRGPGLPPENARQSVRGVDNHEVFRLLGMSGQIVAPVAAPYSNSSYQTFAGQPMRGSDAVLAQSMDGAP